MALRRILFAALLLCLFSATQRPSVFGRWKTIDDVTGKPISVVEIFEKHGKVYGKVVEIIDPKSRGKSCTACEGEDHNKPILGLTVIKDLKRDGDEYSGGKILDPKHGKFYKCYISLEGPNKLKVRGYIGVTLLGRTQYWHRVAGS